MPAERPKIVAAQRKVSLTPPHVRRAILDRLSYGLPTPSPPLRGVRLTAPAAQQLEIPPANDPSLNSLLPPEAGVLLLPGTHARTPGLVVGVPPGGPAYAHQGPHSPREQRVLHPCGVAAGVPEALSSSASGHSRRLLPAAP